MAAVIPVPTRVTALAVVAALGVFLAFGVGAPAARLVEAQPPGGGFPAAGHVAGTMRVPVSDTVLFAARAGTLFAVVIPGSRGAPVKLLRVAPGGAVVRKTARLERAAFLADLSVGPHGLYAGTAVVKRFANVSDELVRLDPRTLTVRARMFLPSRVTTVEQGARMWASLGDGHVLRVDPRTLATLGSRRLLSSPAVLQGASLSKPAFGLGSLWVLAGDARRLELVRMDPSTLTVLSKTGVPTRGRLAQGLDTLTADSQHVYAVGSAVAAVAADGKVAARPAVPPGLATAAADGEGLVGLTNAPAALVLLTRQGRIRARTRVHDAGAQIVVDGRDAWFLGNAGHGNGIVHVRLRFG